MKEAGIKKALEEQQRERNTVEARGESGTAEENPGEDVKEDDVDLMETNDHFVELHNFFLDVCELYVDIVVDKDGRHSRLDRLSRQQLYFLTVEPDDFNQIVLSRSRSQRDDGEDEGPSVAPSVVILEQGEEKKAEEEEAEEKVGKKDAPEEAVTNSPAKVGGDNVEQKRPFQFSDFASAQPPSDRLDSPNVSEDSDLGKGSSSGGRECGSNGRTKVDSVATSSAVGRCTASASVSEEQTAVAADGDEEVFRVTTQTEMDCMMNEYRHRKGQRTMPSSTSTGSTDTPPATASAGVSAANNSNRRKNPFLSRPPASPSCAASASPTADPEIATQHSASMMADSVARAAVWTELVLAVLDMSAAIPDHHFRPMLPVLFPGVRALTAYARDEALKQRVADFFQRVASIYGFNPDPQQ